VTVTVASGIAAPCGSVTVPKSVAPTSWAVLFGATDIKSMNPSRTAILRAPDFFDVLRNVADIITILL
jgi:hypothetical protein